MNETQNSQQSAPTPPPLGHSPTGEAAGDQPAQAGKKNTGMAILAYIIFFIPLLTDAKDDPFVKFHVGQGLTVFVLAAISWVIGMFPIFGWILPPFLHLAVLVFIIIGIINAAQGKQNELPLIGSFAKNFKF